jgi:hypothetical protein
MHYSVLKHCCIRKQISNMNTLRQQINPHMTMVPDADETFGQYVRALIASSKGFTGPFAGLDQPKTTPTPQTSITQGMFGDYLNRSNGGNGDGSFGAQSSTAAPFGSAQAVVDANNFSSAVNSKGVQAALSALFGMPVAKGIGMLGSGINDAQWGGFNSQMDASNNAFGIAAGMPGIGTISDQVGNVSTISNNAIEQAALAAMGLDDSGFFGMGPGQSYGGSPGDGGVGDGVGGTSSSGHGGGDMGHGMDGW